MRFYFAMSFTEVHLLPNSIDPQKRENRRGIAPIKKSREVFHDSSYQLNKQGSYLAITK